MTQGNPGFEGLRNAVRQVNTRPDFVDPKRGIGSPAISTFDVEGALGAQQAATSRNARADARRAAIKAAGGAVEYNARVRGVVPKSGEDQDDGFSFGRMLGKAWDTVQLDHVAEAAGWTWDQMQLDKVLGASLKAAEFGGNAMLLGAEEGSEFVSALTGQRDEFLTKFDEDGSRSEYGNQANWDKLNDPEYGFGKLMGNFFGEGTVGRQANKVLGFVGDVGFDPLTKMTLGANKYTNAAGRIAAANTLRNANTRALEAGGKAIFGADDIARVGKYGVSHADEAMRETLKLGDEGVRWSGMRIPGTKSVGRGVGRGLSEARATIMGGKFGRLTSSVRSPTEIKKQLDIIAGRQSGPIDEALDFFGSNGVRKSVKGEVLMGTRDKAVGAGLRGMKQDGRIAGTHMLEAGNLADETVAGTRKLLDKLHTLAVKHGNTGQKYAKNYVPRFLTPTGRKLMKGIVAVPKKGGSKIKVNTAQSRGASFSRTMQPGDYYVTPLDGGPKITVTLKTASIQEVNEKIGMAILGTKVFEDDLGLILERAIREAADEIAISAQLKYLTDNAGGPFVTAYRSLTELAPDEIADDVAKQLALGSSRTPGGLTTATASKAQRQAAARRAKTVSDVVDAGWDADTSSAFIRTARNGGLGPRVRGLIDEGYDKLATQMRGVGDEIIASPGMRDSFERVIAATADKEFNKVLDAYMDFTRLFKGYATMTPGFHIRNGMSAMFMNFSDGVRVADHRRSFAMMKQVRDDGLDAAWKTWDEGERLGWQMTMGSGVEGSVSNTEIRTAAAGSLRGGIDALSRGGKVAQRFGRILNSADNNWAMRLHRDVGVTRVEGPVRLAVGLNSAARDLAMGAHVDDIVEAGVARITRLHFNYGELSSFDQVSKSMIPFWTFMSRNIPLQLQQQFMRPRAYARYAALRDNIDLSVDDDSPEWMQGAARVYGGWYAKPDMPFVDLEQDSRSFTGGLKGIIPSINPLLKTSYELSFDRKSFRDMPFREGENRWLYALESLIPLLGRADQLSGGNLRNAIDTDRDVDWSLEKSINSALGIAGIPVKHRSQEDLAEAAYRERKRALDERLRAMG